MREPLDVFAASGRVPQGLCGDRQAACCMEGFFGEALQFLYFDPAL